ncbi:MAG: GNAT family N-acetyltransferase [Flavobacteriaceae bacterium]
MSKIEYTKRFELRPFSLDDAGHLFHLDNNEAVHRYLGQNPVKDINQSVKIVEDLLQQYKNNGIGRWAIFRKEDGRFLGWSGLKLEDEGYYDIGYRLLPEFWGQGIAFETATFWLDYGFKTLNLPDIIGDAHIGNIASNKVLRKIGLKYRHHLYWNGIMCNRYGLKNPY